MVITLKRGIGDRGEEVVSMFLMKQGFRIIERNYWRPWGEIDIVARDIKDNSYHFVEVKSVTRDIDKADLDSDYSPADNMTSGKRDRLSRVIQTYVSENRLGESDWQVDVALVYLDKYSNGFKIEMIDDVEL